MCVWQAAAEMDARLKFVSGKIADMMGLDAVLVGEYFRFFEEEVLAFLEGKGPDRILATEGNGAWSEPAREQAGASLCLSFVCVCVCVSLSLCVCMSVSLRLMCVRVCFW